MTNIVKLKSEFRIQQDAIKKEPDNQSNETNIMYKSYLECVKKSEKSETECRKILETKAL